MNLKLLSSTVMVKLKLVVLTAIILLTLLLLTSLSIMITLALISTNLIRLPLSSLNSQELQIRTREKTFGSINKRSPLLNLKLDNMNSRELLSIITVRLRLEV